MKDRIPLYPGRVKLVPVVGEENTYNLVRADQPTQAGTPLNKSSLLKDTTSALYGLDENAVPDDLFRKLSDSLKVEKVQTRLSNLPVGAVFQVDETGDGTLVDFVKLKGDYESSGRTLVRRASVINVTTIFSSSPYGPYEDTELDTSLNVTYYGTLSPKLKSAIQNVEIHAYPSTTLNRKVFAPSITETGFLSYTGDGTKIQGVTWPSAPGNYWTRSGYSGSTSEACYITSAGTSWGSASRSGNGFYVLPMFTLPSDFEIEGSISYAMTSPDGTVRSEEVFEAIASFITVPESVNCITGATTVSSGYDYGSHTNVNCKLPVANAKAVIAFGPQDGVANQVMFAVQGYGSLFYFYSNSTISSAKSNTGINGDTAYFADSTNKSIDGTAYYMCWY